MLARALAKTPGDRFASCRDFADALRAAFGLVPYNSGSGHAIGAGPIRLATDVGRAGADGDIPVPASYQTPDVPLSHAVTERGLNTPAAKQPRPARTTPAPSVPVEEPAPAPSTSSPTPTPAPSNPNPFPTYTCDPSVVTCSSPSPAAGF